MAEDAKKRPIIIIKRKVVAHAAHHGGAWKVAYADFVTAMMCFFLVMWLMGSDEETKAAISHYFNHPTTPYKQGADPQSKIVRPLGDLTDQGESIMNGMDGKTPDDLVERPSKPFNRQLAENEQMSETARQLLDGEIYGIDASIENLKFSIPAHHIFLAGSTEWSDEATATLTRLGRFMADYKGHVTVTGHTDDDPASLGKFSNAFEFTNARAVAIMQWLVSKNYISEDRIHPVGSGVQGIYSTNGSPAGRKKNRRVEFTMASAQ